jgi:hypothetical protein
MNSTSCQQVLEQLTAYADGELSQADAQGIAAHLAECDDCRTELMLLERSLELARDIWQESVVGAATPGPSRARSPLRVSATLRVAASVAVLIVTTRLLVAGGIGHVAFEPYKAVPVSGKVTFEDGTPIPVGRMTVVFTSLTPPVEKNVTPRPARAEVKVADGAFSEVTTHRLGDGLILGRHTVEAFSYDGKGKPVKLAINPTEIEVSKKSTVFEFKVKK